jgi:SAM-dependent methyltransferase
MSNDAQVQYWNEQAGHTWAEMQPLLDLQLAPLGERAIAALAPQPGENVLDIGCGCGDTTRRLAALVAPAGNALGIDISAPMLAVASASTTAQNIRFAQQDAQTARFDTALDAAFSRFGVMFFADPTAAFANIHAALRPGGRLAFVCWRAAAENPWMMVPLAAALRFLPPPPPPNPFEPGPFAFADANRLRHILTQAGFAHIEIESFNTDIGGFNLDQAVTLALRVGPLGKLLRETPGHDNEVVAAVREALAAHATAEGIRLASATWVVTATR